jgi:hypothetical protein
MWTTCSITLLVIAKAIVELHATKSVFVCLARAGEGRLGESLPVKGVLQPQLLPASPTCKLNLATDLRNTAVYLAAVLV